MADRRRGEEIGAPTNQYFTMTGKGLCRCKLAKIELISSSMMLVGMLSTNGVETNLFTHSCRYISLEGRDVWEEFIRVKMGQLVCFCGVTKKNYSINWRLMKFNTM